MDRITRLAAGGLSLASIVVLMGMSPVQTQEAPTIPYRDRGRHAITNRPPLDRASLPMRPRKVRDVSAAAIAQPSSDDPATPHGPGDYSTGFEPNEGFNPGPVGGQAGWGMFPNEIGPQIANVNPAEGIQHLRFFDDPQAPPGFPGNAGFSPNFGPQPLGPSSVSVKVNISGLGGADYYVNPQAPSQSLTSARVDFSFDGNIFILDGPPGGPLQFVDSGADWVPGQTYSLRIEFDPQPPQIGGGGVIRYFINDQPIFVGTRWGGSGTEQVVLLDDQTQLPNEVCDFDVLDVSGGEPPPPPICSTCTGDTNGDGLRNGRDVRSFVQCVMGSGSNCVCADTNGDGTADIGDVNSFVAALLSGVDCPFAIDLATSAFLVLQVSNPPLGIVQVELTSSALRDTRILMPPPPYFTGQPIQTEMIQLELTGVHPQIGEVRLHESLAFPSFGHMNNVVVGPDGQFQSYDSFFDVFVTIELPNVGAVGFNPSPVHVQSPGNTVFPPSVPHTSGPTSVPLQFNPPTIVATIIDVVHRVERVCIYQVTCMDGPCNDCPVNLGDICTGARCVNTCASFNPTTCGANNCCVIYSLIDCNYSAQPPCQIGNSCTCDPTPGKCCLPDGSCVVVTEAECKDSDGVYGGDGSACAPPQRCCLPDGSCINTDPMCCAIIGGVPGPGMCAPPQKCCLGDSSCINVDPVCCVILHGGTVFPGLCQPPEACCFPDGSCQNLDPNCCLQRGGVPDGPGLCIPPQKCCLPDSSCVNADPLCCLNVLGGTPFPGACALPEACCFADGSCVNLDPDCCTQRGGIPDGPGVCVPPQACCFPDGTCIMADPFCCPDLGGTPRGAGTNCADPDICKGACCHGNGTCTQTTQAACNGANDTFKGIGTNCADFQPTITAQPQSVTACVGENAVFTIAATGTGTLHYQWQKNGANIGADAATLTLMAVQVADDSAVITCKVTDDCGMVNSAAATLLVLGLTSQTESLVPANRDRLTLGIGERVTISTNPARVVNWAVAGGGAVAPAMGAATVFTASMSPSTSTITATLGAKACTIVFEVIAPTGINFAVDNNPGCGVAGPPNNEIGARTVFDFTIQPVTVSFYRANFRENIPGNAWVWPDGTAGAFPAQVVPYMVNQANSGEDTSSNCTFPIGRLDPPPPGGGLMAFTYNINVPGEYQNQGGAWVVFIAGETHPKEFDAAGQCRTIINATNGATNGAWQGPWQ